ncbi:MAG TPA: SCO family protein [Vicinamibacterales bacterium]|nr:SCO family protein [Vicinamibacterales bacterium]
MRNVLSAAALAAVAAAACARGEAPKRYELTGQVLAVRADRQQITIKHEDIVGYMPAMTMSFAVARPDLLTGREPGELVKATLEVQDMIGRLVEITRTGTAPLPDLTNEAELAAGLLEVGDEVPDAAFIDQTDRRRSFSEWRGGDVLVTFIYTQCPLPNFCPLMDQNFATLQDAIGEDAALRGRVTLVTISFDPAHDTPAVLAAHARRRRADPAVWTFLTGDRVTVDRFAARLGVGVVRPGNDSNVITHNLRTIHVGPDGRIAKIYSGNEWIPSQVLTDLRAAVRQP